jgi:hypothetical protein
MVRKMVLAVSALALACGGIVATEGVAYAKKIAPTGTLSCTTTGFTTITPGILLSIPPIVRPGKPDKPGKDKKPKYVSTGTLTGCTGTETAGILPTSATSSSKSKGLSRALIQPASSCSAPARVAKAKITLNTGLKLKVNQTTGSSIAFNPTTQVQTPFPPCGADSATANAFAAAHASDRIMVVSTGVSTGKAYLGRTVTSTSVTVQTLFDQLVLSLAEPGVVQLDADPAFSTLTIE